VSYHASHSLLGHRPLLVAHTKIDASQRPPLRFACRLLRVGLIGAYNGHGSKGFKLIRENLHPNRSLRRGPQPHHDINPEIGPTFRTTQASWLFDHGFAEGRTPRADDSFQIPLHNMQARPDEVGYLAISVTRKYIKIVERKAGSLA
jgi:hypothetical protein